MINILYAEDDENDALLFTRALRRSQVDATLRIVPSGRCAIEYLQGTGEFVDRASNPLPDLIFMDWHMPTGGGSELLTWCRKSTDFVGIPIVVLSGSGFPAEVEQVKQLGANKVWEKTGNPQELANRLSQLCSELVRPAS